MPRLQHAGVRRHARGFREPWSRPGVMQFLPLLIRALSLFLCIAAGAAHAAEPLDLQAVEGRVSMQPVWEAARAPRAWTIDDPRDAQHKGLEWSPAPVRAIRLGDDEALWLRFTVAGYGALAPPRWLLELPRPGLDRAELFRFEDGQLMLDEVAGDGLSVAVWPVSGRFPAFEVVPTRWVPVTYYLRVTHHGAFTLTGRIRTAEDALREQRQVNFLFGGFFGALGLLAALAAGALVATRRLPYLSFCLYALATAGAFFAASGLLGEWWPQGPVGVIDAAPYVVAELAAAFGLLYLVSTVALNELSPWRFAVTVGVSGTGLVVAAASLVLQGVSAEVAAGYALVCVAAAIWLLVLSRLKGESWSRLHLASLLPYAVALCAPLGEVALGARLPTEAFGLVAAAAAAHLALSYFATNSKMKMLREATMRVQASSTVDPLTGVANYRRFRLRVPDLMARARHYRHHGALLLLEIITLEEFRRAGGQRGQEMALVLAAELIRGCVKNIDMVSRVGDALFAVAVEGPVSEQDANAIASQILARGLRLASAPPHLTPLAFRIYIELVPRPGQDLEQLLGKALRHLRSVPRSDPRRIFMASDLDPADAAEGDTAAAGRGGEVPADS